MPLASLQVHSNGCTNYLGQFLGFDCPVICTIRTAFLPEGFKEQLQKQIAAGVTAALGGKKGTKQDKGLPLLTSSS